MSTLKNIGIDQTTGQSKVATSSDIVELGSLKLGSTGSNPSGQSIGNITAQGTIGGTIGTPITISCGTGVSGAGGQMSLSSGGTADGDGGAFNVTMGSGTGSNGGAGRSGGAFTVTTGNRSSGTTSTAGIIRFVTGGTGGLSGATRYIVNGGQKTVNNGSPTDLFTIVLPTSPSPSVAGGTVHITALAEQGGGSLQTTTVLCTYAAQNAATTVTSQVTLNTSNTSTTVSSGTLTITAAMQNNASSVTFQVTVTSSFGAPNPIAVLFQVHNNSTEQTTFSLA